MEISRWICSLTGMPLLDGMEVICATVRRWYDTTNNVFDSQILRDVRHLSRGIFEPGSEWGSAYLRDITATSHPGLTPWEFPYMHSVDGFSQTIIDPSFSVWINHMHLLFFNAKAWDQVAALQYGVDGYDRYRDLEIESEEREAADLQTSAERVQHRRYQDRPDRIRWLDQPLHTQFWNVAVFCQVAKIPMFAHGDAYFETRLPLFELQILQKLRANQLAQLNEREAVRYNDD